MPGRNGRGPFGEGPMTGRGLGLCGLARRRSPGRRSIQMTASSSDQKRLLKEKLESIEAERRDLLEQMQDLD